MEYIENTVQNIFSWEDAPYPPTVQGLIGGNPGTCRCKQLLGGEAAFSFLIPCDSL